MYIYIVMHVWMYGCMDVVMCESSSCIKLKDTLALTTGVYPVRLMNYTHHCTYRSAELQKSSKVLMFICFACVRKKLPTMRLPDPLGPSTIATVTSFFPFTIAYTHISITTNTMASLCNMSCNTI